MTLRVVPEGLADASATFQPLTARPAPAHGAADAASASAYLVGGGRR
ncbi:hypothetical protein BN971_00065 [Mycobacterium bohemicum DSM 44277]|jgi:hypothetical protein|uniref:Uncharacterized protein n=1 Tax=Mycobacterium bohemicum DSM 44277 TaxID=1236609 RepID=A0A0U0W1X9_MYCBE|nr:hypothetical protein BN971_00065 [Mycobacterium bohemicum DSM 44277]